MSNKGHFYIKLSNRTITYKEELNRSYFRKEIIDNNVKIYLRTINKDNGFIELRYVGNLIFVDTKNDMYVVETDNEDIYNNTYIGDIVFETPKKLYNVIVINALEVSD